MASPTKKSKIQRRAKKAAIGKERKLRIRREGSTPLNLVLNKPNANEKAQKAKKA
jgi:hypothetical protein